MIIEISCRTFLEVNEEKRIEAEKIRSEIEKKYPNIRVNIHEACNE